MGAVTLKSVFFSSLIWIACGLIGVTLLDAAPDPPVLNPSRQTDSRYYHKPSPHITPPEAFAQACIGPHSCLFQALTHGYGFATILVTNAHHPGSCGIQTRQASDPSPPPDA
jgi:hypothetical protein